MTYQTITFKFKNKDYKFKRPYPNPHVDSLTTFQWIRDCYASIGAKPKQVTHRQMTFSNWWFWCGFIV